MRPRPSRVFDSSALADLFRGHRPLHDILVQAEDGWFQILLPTAAMADAEAAVVALVLGRARDARLARMIGREVRKRDRDDTDNDL